jgi:cell division transport system permease protein
MAQFGKSSSKRGKPNYITAIIGVSLVLFLFGIVGWILINLRKAGDYVKEQVQVQAFVNRDASKKVIDSATVFIRSLPYIKSVEYVSREMAVKKYENENDTIWKTFIDANPLPGSIEYYVKANYVQTDSLNKIANHIQEAYPALISEFQFPKAIVGKIGGFTRNIVLGLLIAALILSVLVIFSIDSTIRLAMFSNRFLIKTMQMVGATRWFISKPLDIRAIINGLISALLSIVLLWISIFIIESFWPEIKLLRDNKSMLLLFGAMILVGVAISFLSTHRAVIKYLKLKLDDLY